MTTISAPLREIGRSDSGEVPDSIFQVDRDGGEAGAAHPNRVVLVHCSASSSRQWNPIVAQLDGYRAIAPDLWGHGARASAPGTAPRTLDEEAAAIEAACPDGAPFHLIGHSYGGAVALNYALHHPGRLRSLTLVEPSCFHVLKSAPVDASAELAEIRAVARAVESRVASGDNAAAMQGFVDYWSGPGFWADLAEGRKTQFARLAPVVAAHFRSLIDDGTVLASYARIVVPVLILCGNQSPQPSRTITRLLAETLPTARHRTIRGVGHMAPITHPDDVNPMIVAHLAQVDRDFVPI